MLVYLNGVNDVSTLGKFKIKIPVPKVIQKIVDTTKKLIPPVIIKAVTKVDDKVKADAQKIVDQAKSQAKKLGLGIQRLASIPQSLANKAFLSLVSQNKFTLATRMVETYKLDPNGLKAIAAANKLPWNDLQNAINKGAKSSISGTYNGRHKHDRDPKPQPHISSTYLRGNAGDRSGPDAGGDAMDIPADTSSGSSSSSGPTASQYEGWTKSAVGIFKQIVQWFKKHKKHKASDDTAIAQMAAQVDADPTIPKYDEHGNLLPNADGSYPPKKSNAGGVVLGLGAAAIAAKLLLAAS